MAGGMMTDIATIIDDFSYIDDWEDRYRYVIDLGRDLPPFPDDERNDVNKVQGCVSQVWLTTARGDGEDPVSEFAGDSDAHIVRGLVALHRDLRRHAAHREGAALMAGLHEKK
jgi:cysteine desulfuration protein SufE